MTEQPTDQDLLRDFSERGSEMAFRSLVERHVDLVFATAMRGLNDESAAHEVGQNVFLVLARRARALHREHSITGWLYKTTLLETRQWWRGELRRQRREQTAVELNTTMQDDDSLLKSLSGVLDEGLMELRDADREALLLRFFEEKSHREIGNAIGTNEDAARKRIDKALEKLAEFFRRRGYAVPAAAVTAVALQGSVRAAPVGFAAKITTAVLSHASLHTAASITTAKAALAMTTVQKTFIATTIVIAGLTSLVVEQKSEAKLRDERVTLQSQADEAQLLQVDNERLSNVLPQLNAGASPSRELLKLRGLSTLLVRRTNELKQLAEKNRTFGPALALVETNRIAEGYLPRETWSFVGFATPEDAYQSSAWAVEHHENKAFLECVTPKFYERFKDTATVQGLNSIVSSEAKEYKVVHKDERSEDEIILHVARYDYFGMSVVNPVRLKRIDGQWKLALPTE